MGQDVVELNAHGFTHLMSLGNAGHSGAPTTGRNKLRENGLPNLARNVPRVSNKSL